MKNRPLFLIVVAAAVAVTGYFWLKPSVTQSAQKPVVAYNNELPSAFGKWDVVKADTMAVLLDLTKDQVMGELPEVALTGKTVKVTCKKSRFSVTPTNRQEAVRHEVYSPGHVVELADNGAYTILLFSDGEEPKPTAVSYIVKMDEADLKELEKGMAPQPAQPPDPGSI